MRDELAGWREALANGALRRILVRLLIAIALVSIGLIGAGQPVLTLGVVCGVLLLGLLVRLRLTGRD